jgi:glycosyltransferase involved in cell wall biosynthesis
MPRLADGDDRTVLGFVGGMSRHKGYHLFREALETGDYPQFKAVVVDHGMEPGETSYTSQWGSTEIEFIPKVKQQDVAQLYSRLDVLIAPSIWPESFGLVTREAAQAGVWVIASDRGAIGDCVIEGHNGNIISVEDSKGLMRALDALKTGGVRRAPTLSPSVAMASQSPLQTVNPLEKYIGALTNAYRKTLRADVTTDSNPESAR